MEAKINIIIPAYNEEKRIIQTLEKITSYLRENWRDYKIIIINDGSNDRTEELVKSYMLSNPNIQLKTIKRNLGKGYSVKVGVSLSDGDLIVFTDVDLSAPIQQVEDLIGWIKNEYDLVIGSRYINGAKILIQQPLYRRLLSRTFNFFVKFLFGLPIEDTQCRFKMFTRRLLTKREKIDFFFLIPILVIFITASMSRK